MAQLHGERFQNVLKDLPTTAELCPRWRYNLRSAVLAAIGDQVALSTWPRSMRRRWYLSRIRRTPWTHPSPSSTRGRVTLRRLLDQATCVCHAGQLVEDRVVEDASTLRRNVSKDLEGRNDTNRAAHQPRRDPPHSPKKACCCSNPLDMPTCTRSKKPERASMAMPDQLAHFTRHPTRSIRTRPHQGSKWLLTDGDRSDGACEVP